MRLSQSESVVQRGRDHKFRNKFKSKRKHKKLDAICEKSYSSSHKGVERVESSELNNGGDELELRRSNRARKAPVLLDSSPVPPKKRQKVDRSVQCETPCSSSRDVDEESDGWRTRLRSRGKSSMKGKRKLFEDSDDGSGDDDMDPPSYDNKDKSEEGEKSTVVKSKRPGRIKASNILANENTEFDEVLEVMDDVDGLHLEVKLECGNENGVEKGHVGSDTTDGDEASDERDPGLEECHTNGNVETGEECNVPEKITNDKPDDENFAEADSAPDDQENDEGHHDKPLDDDDQEKDEGRQDKPLDDDDQEKDEGRQDKPLDDNDDVCTKSKGKCNVSAVVDRKPRIKLGRRCGLCGGGTDGKPPRILVLEGAGSDNEAYSGSSGSEVPNYDVLDGFCDQPGWLGRLLGPINDRFGIAGIWVHQQCAVWSPEVYFAGLGCLKNVRAALYRGRVLKCSRCGRPGATIGCRVDRCPKTYHLPCARSKSCIFDHRKFLIACTDHRRLFQPHGIQNAQRIKKLKAKKLKLELRKVANDACRKDIEAEEKWLENCGEDEEFLKRESKRLHRDLWRIAPTFIGGSNSEPEKQFQGWESVAGLQDVIGCMKEVVILPLLYPEFFSNIGLTPPRGVLLHGHPGTGKTLVVRALVGSCARGDRKIAYFARKGADCLGKYVGDSERQLRLLFQVAEKSQPSIIFFDEIDGLAPCRTKQQDQTHNSVVSTLLALMDGLKSRGSVIVIGATNRPDAVDPALRRPGRFDREIYFPLPSVKDREAILSLHTQKWPRPVTGTLLKWVAQKTVGFAGADLQALCTQAAIIALRRSFPLHEVLSAAEKRATESKCPAIPSFAVEERDWLKALSCAPPPCSRRESGIALNDVVSSPLEIHLVPCLLLPLTRLLVRLYLDERVWLPPHLKKAATLVKHIIVSALSGRSVQSDNWWLRIDDLLHEADVMNEIEKNILLANVLVGESNLCGSNVRDENTDEGCLDISPSKSQCIGGARPGLLQNMSYGDCNKPGFQVLICGNPRSGQRHLASCLVHYFVGNVDVWKIDLAGISHEGHGDMVLGLTHLLMRCARSSLCLLYMPMIDLWAIETYIETSEDGCEVDMENGLHSSSDEEATWSQPTAKKASYIWTSFIEQVESMRVNTSLIVLATSELPLSSLPDRISQFFGDESLNCSFSHPSDHKVPRFSVQLDGNFNHDKVINSFAAKLTKDLTQHFVHSLRGENHNLEKSEKSYDMVKGDVARPCQIKHSHVSSSTPVVLSSKNIKSKSSLSLAIATFGYQMLCYPHFAELCWVTSKLKDGPFANTNGPWKGWPFNSCIVRPMDSAEKVVTAQSGSSNTKTKESGLVRGLVAVALSAYRGEYTSLREVCSEVRKVLETLVGRIDEKIQAGKDRSLFIRILSQVAYLEDMIISWAHALYSLEVDSHKLEVLDANIRESEVLEKSHEEVNAGRSDPTADAGDEVAVNDNGCANADDEVAVNDNGCADDGNEVAVTEKEDTLASNGVNLESSFKTDTAADLAESVSVKLSNVFFTDSGSDIQSEGPSFDLGENMISKPSSSTCFYECCFECYVNLRNLLLRIINNKWEAIKGNESTVEDVHDFVASLSANLFLSLSNLFEGENNYGMKMEIKGGECRKRCTCECKKQDKLSMVECGCHATTSRGLDSRFVFKDGVLAALDTDTGGGDVSYHCKLEKLCLCVLTEWLVTSKEEIIH